MVAAGDKKRREKVFTYPRGTLLIVETDDKGNPKLTVIYPANDATAHQGDLDVGVGESHN